jgi:DNA-binding PadR family transcriptional regulator
MRFRKHHPHHENDWPEEFEGQRGHRRGGRLFGHGDLKLLLLANIAERPMHGYELIRSVEEMCGGAYSPSPGTVYPSLSLLEDQGLIRSIQSPDGSNRKQFEITEEGRSAVATEAEMIAIIRDRLKMLASNAASERPPFAVRRALHQLRHALMRPEGAWNDAEIERVKGIIERAAVETARGS